MNFKNIKILSLALIISSSLYAAPAFTKWRTIVQPSGEEIKVQMNGDEYFKWYITEDKTVLVFNEDTKSFDYAKMENGNLKSIGKRYSKFDTKMKDIARAKSFNDDKPQLKSPGTSNVQEEINKIHKLNKSSRLKRNEIKIRRNMDMSGF